MTIQINNRQFKFKDSYNDFTLIDIKKWLPLLEKLNVLNGEFLAKIAEYDGLAALVDMGMTEQAEDEERVIQSEIDELRMKISDVILNLIDVCCKTSKAKTWIENKVGYEGLILIFEQIARQYGDFVDYFNNCPMVEVFKHKGLKQWFGITYKVHGLDRTTLMRDALATVESTTAFNLKLEVSSGAWDNICKFVALVARPVNQEYEIGFTRKSFINANAMKGLDFSDKTILYQKTLEESAQKRSVHFENLPLPVAIGVLKMYEKKKLK